VHQKHKPQIFVFVTHKHKKSFGIAPIILSGAYGTSQRTVQSSYVGRADVGTLVWVGRGARDGPEKIQD
jgi:hypothetical protein